MFAGGFSHKCEEKDISYKDTVKDTNPKALHGIIPMPTTSTTTSKTIGPKEQEWETTYHATILKFDTTKFLWSQVGNMTTARTNHGASVIKIEDVKKFCT